MGKSCLKGCFCSKARSSVNKIVMLSLTQHLQRLSFINSVRGRSRIKYGMTPLCNKGGFTLIELLVVVLIIGILAAVAVPQYRLAVGRSRYATIKNLTDSIAKAEELYYLAQGKYADDFAKLDISMPDGKLQTSTHWNYVYDWGSCWLVLVDPWYLVRCQQDDIAIAYSKSLHLSKMPDVTSCTIFETTNLSDWRNKICELETNGTGSVDTTQKQIVWRYK